jgi:hypothetical protein
MFPPTSSRSGSSRKTANPKRIHSGRQQGDDLSDATVSHGKHH